MCDQPSGRGKELDEMQRVEHMRRFLLASADEFAGRPLEDLDADELPRYQRLQIALLPDLAAAEPDRATRADLYLQELAPRAEQLAGDIEAARAALRDAGDHSNQPIGHRLGDAARTVHSTVQAITQTTEDDLARIRSMAGLSKRIEPEQQTPPGPSSSKSKLLGSVMACWPRCSRLRVT